MNDYVVSFNINPDKLPGQVLLLLSLAALTTLLEAPVVLTGFKKSVYRHKVLLLILVNFLTNIVINCILLAFMDVVDSYDALLLILEVLVVACEAVLYRIYIRDIGLKRIIFVSLLANVISFVLGFLIIYLIDSAYGLYWIYGL